MGEQGAFRPLALIVEDDADQRSLIAMLLEDGGFETVASDSAEAALAIMLLRGGEVCLVVADLHLSGLIDGVELARELKVRWPHLTVLLTSGNAGSRLVDLPPGIESLPKPWECAHLLAAAERARGAARVAPRRGFPGRG
jgi:DNA-binding NtrC family response regulator